MSEAMMSDVPASTPVEHEVIGIEEDARWQWDMHDLHPAAIGNLMRMVGVVAVQLERIADAAEGRER